MNNKEIKVTDLTRFVEASGRIFIPCQIREQLNIKNGDGFNFFVDKQTKKIILKPSRKMTKTEKINEWVKNIFNDISLSFRQIDFITQRNVVVCICSADESGFITNDIEEIDVGIAICSSDDKFNLDIGKCISYCKAIGKSIPRFIYEK